MRTMQKKRTYGLTAAALSSILAASAVAQDQQSRDLYRPSNPTLESERFYTEPEFSLMPAVGMEFSGPFLAAVALGLEFCATDEPDDFVSACLGGTYNPVRMTFVSETAGTPRYHWDTNAEGFPLTVASPIDRMENESLGMLYGNVAFHAIPGSPSLDIDLGIAARYIQRRTQEVTGAHQEGPSVETVIETTVPFVGLEACEGALCVGLRWGLNTGEGGTLTQLLYGIQWE